MSARIERESSRQTLAKAASIEYGLIARAGRVITDILRRPPQIDVSESSGDSGLIFSSKDDYKPVLSPR